MSRLGKIARRSFLISSAAIVGGVAFGVYYAKKDVTNPLTPAEGEATLNPYILIDAAGVTLIAPRAEMGQGTRTTLAALVAEELDVAWEDIRVLHGPPAQAYYNGAIMGAALPFSDYAMTALQRGIADNLGFISKALSAQITGGSTAMVDGFDKMRHAGATARETLKLAAAQRLGIPADQLKTQNGQVIAPDGTALSYSDLAQDAATLKAPDVDLRDPSQWKYLGHSMPRVDMVEKSTGTATFGIDIRPEGLKFAALRINPKLGGAMIGYDDTAAKSMPGVEKIVDMGNGIAVVATNTWLAMQAAEAVDITWGPSPHPQNDAAIFAQIKAAFDTPANSTFRDDGDTATLPEGATLIEAEYSAPHLAHATMEPLNATALYTGDAMTLWTGNQAPVLMQAKCAAEVGLEPQAVTLHTPYMGGGFGRRGEYDFGVYAARLAKQLPNTPVQLTWSREEDMRHDFYRPAGMARFRGAVQNGKAVMLDGQIAAQSVAQQAGKRLFGLPIGGPDKALVEGAFDQPYAIPNYRIRGHLADMDMPIGFWRSVGASLTGFFHDSFIDELAHAAGADPLAFRLDLMQAEDPRSAACLEAVKQMSGWSGKTAANIGRGVGFTYSFGTPVAQVIEVEQLPTGIRISRAWIAADVGTALDPSIVEAQLFGGMAYGLSAAVHGKISFAEGEVEQFNFPDYDAIRMHTMPSVEVHVLSSGHHLSGAGEPGTPPSMPALANALFDLTGTRARSLPLIDHYDLLT